LTRHVFTRRLLVSSTARNLGSRPISFNMANTPSRSEFSRRDVYSHTLQRQASL